MDYGQKWWYFISILLIYFAKYYFATNNFSEPGALKTKKLSLSKMMKKLIPIFNKRRAPNKLWIQINDRSASMRSSFK